MKKAVGMVEILLVIVVVTAIYFMCFHPKYGRSNPFADNEKIKSQQELVDDKLKDIEVKEFLGKAFLQSTKPIHQGINIQLLQSINSLKACNLIKYF